MALFKVHFKSFKKLNLQKIIPVAFGKGWRVCTRKSFSLVEAPRVVPTIVELFLAIVAKGLLVGIIMS